MTKGEFALRPFVPAEDGLADEHVAVSRWVEEAKASLGPHDWYRTPELKSLQSGKVLLDATSDQARRYVLAALAQAQHWDEEAQQIRAQGKNEIERMNPHLHEGWSEVWGRRRQAEAVMAALMRRSLPFEEIDLLAFLEWCNSTNQLGSYFAPIGSIARAVQRYTEQKPITPNLRDALRRFAAQLRGTNEKDAKRLGTAVEQLCADGLPAANIAAVADIPAKKRSVPPAVAGNPAVLSILKGYLGLAVDDGAATEELGPDHFPLRQDSPLRDVHNLLSGYFGEVIGKNSYTRGELQGAENGRRVAKLDAGGRGRALLAAAERNTAGLLQGIQLDDRQGWQSYYAAAAVVPTIASLNVAFDRQGAFDFLLYAAARPQFEQAALKALQRKVLEQVKLQEFSDGERYVLWLLRASLIAGPPLGSPSDEVLALTKMIGDGASFYLVPGEAWSDAVNADIAAAKPDGQALWVALLRQMLKATTPRPSTQWLKVASQTLKSAGEKKLSVALSRWLPLVNEGRTIRRMGTFHGDTRSSGDLMHEENATCLRGMLWLVPTLRQKEELVRLVAGVALSAYRKVPGVGPRAVKVGNAAVYALSEIASPEAVGQLAMLKVRVKFGTAQKEIEKAFSVAAERLGLPRDQIEEMGIPSYGMEEVGLRRESFGDEFAAEVRVNGRDVVLSWFKDSKPMKSVPAKVKSEHKEELKELQGAVKDIGAMLGAQAERIDSMFLLQKSWPVQTWRERYLDHPLVGTIARRLIWSFRSGGRELAGMWCDGRIVDVDDAPLELPPDAHVELWHPIGRLMDDVLAWRAWLQRHEVQQPFKQAHREVYLLTDAERRTSTYSNRFAAHVLRQHQFSALCAIRGWKNRLRLLVDDEFPPASRELPNWGLRAEFWIEGIGDNYGQDTNDSGVFLRVSTDQVRFYRLAATENRAHAGGGGYVSSAAGPGEHRVNEHLPLDQIPPLVFSEVMRDVDLFVGVASVGNDPTWQDGGPEGRYRDYWQSYSFGELSETAKTRRAVLEGLLPRLSKIRERCSLEERFLVVRGDLRTYKIHLGSGNILMRPNDEYLCIVPDRSSRSDEIVSLPFEGDGTLAIILSKAFLLAEDVNIKDPTITRQIKGS